MTAEPKALKTRIAIGRIEDLAETRDIRPLDREHVDRLAIAVGSLPPVDVVKLAGGRFGLLAGYHRREAHRVAGVATMRIVVHNLEPEQWFPFAVRSNLAHGLPLTLAQRKAAAVRMLDDDPRRSDRAIAADCGLSHPTIAKLRQPDPDDDAAGKDFQLRVGRDGKARQVPAPPTEAPAPATIPEFAAAIEAAATEAPTWIPEDDTGCLELELELEAVLVRWGVPDDVGTPHALNAQADRGDLASDLADTAWRALKEEP